MDKSLVCRRPANPGGNEENQPSYRSVPHRECLLIKTIVGAMLSQSVLFSSSNCASQPTSAMSQCPLGAGNRSQRLVPPARYWGSGWTHET